MATQEVTTLPEYVEYGGRVTAPGDFDCRGGHFRGWLLQGDMKKITKRIDLMFNRPAKGAETFRVLTDKVLMLNGWFDTVRAMTPPWDEVGTVREEQISFWVPLAQGHEENGRFQGRRIVMAVPFIFVDNPMSYAGGREAYGYPKSLGRFVFRDDVNGVMTVDTYGGPYGRDSEARWRPIITITPRIGRGGMVPEHLDGENAFIDHITGGQLDPEHPSLLPGGIEIWEDAIREALAGRSHQLFLKQFRDASVPGAACYQEIVEAPITLGNTEADFTPDIWDVEITDFDSHPICKELGVKSQTTVASYAMRMDFVCGRGNRVWPKTRVPDFTG